MRGGICRILSAIAIHCRYYVVIRTISKLTILRLFIYTHLNKTICSRYQNMRNTVPPRDDQSSNQADGIDTNHEDILNENTSTQWWNHEDFPYSAPWWFRYPASIIVFAASYFTAFEWNQKAGWIVGILLLIIGLGLIRELFLGITLATFVGLTLWALGAAVSALPVSAAIIIGAMIIAQSMHR